jgi:hypothetical protein
MPGERIKLKGTIAVEIALGSDRIIFERSDCVRGIALSEVRTATRKFPSAVELATVDRLYLLDFAPSPCDPFVRALAQIGGDLTRSDAELQRLWTDWKTQKVSAFAYLSRLKHLIGCG